MKNLNRTLMGALFKYVTGNLVEELNPHSG
jgi:hypothetical protein